jgi:hypothetical protein
LIIQNLNYIKYKVYYQILKCIENMLNQVCWNRLGWSPIPDKGYVTKMIEIDGGSKLSVPDKEIRRTKASNIVLVSGISV